MPSGDRPLRLMLAAGFGLFALLWAGFLGQKHLAGDATILDRIEAPLLDLRFLVAGPRPAPPDLVIVALDDDTVREAGRFPLPRATLAGLVRELSSHGAKAIALDILFIDPGPPADDRALAAALGSAKVVIAAAGLFPGGGATAAAPSRGIPVVDRVIWPVEALRAVAALGLVNITTDHAGTPRHVPLLVRHEDGPVPSFPLQTAARALAAEAALDSDRITIGTAVTRMDLGFHLPLRFYGARGTISTISARAVLRGEVPRRAIEGRTVIVGATALGTSDTFATPFDPVLPGVEVLATAVGHLLAGDGLIRDRSVRRSDVVAAVVFAVGSVLLISLAPLGPALALTAIAAGAWLAITAMAFFYGYWVSAVVPLAALALPAALCAIGRYSIDRLKMRQLARAEGALRRFQPPVLADRIAVDPTFLAHPVQQDTPILFIDLSNFTRSSERLGPGTTRELLREFHGVVEGEVTRHGGLVLSFMGDGAMIAFGLPKPGADDASRALKAALALCHRVHDWIRSRSAEWAGKADQLDVRVGAHFGPVVMSRLGTDTHQHITATGDCVNVASRLLEVAARSGASVVVSADLLDAAGECDAPSFGERRSVDIRGREQPLLVALWPCQQDPPARSARP